MIILFISVLQTTFDSLVYAEVRPDLDGQLRGVGRR